MAHNPSPLQAGHEQRAVALWKTHVPLVVSLARSASTLGHMSITLTAAAHALCEQLAVALRPSYAPPAAHVDLVGSASSCVDCCRTALMQADHKQPTTPTNSYVVHRHASSMIDWTLQQCQSSCTAVHKCLTACSGSQKQSFPPICLLDLYPLDLYVQSSALRAGGYAA